MYQGIFYSMSQTAKHGLHSDGAMVQRLSNFAAAAAAAAVHSLKSRCTSYTKPNQAHTHTHTLAERSLQIQQHLLLHSAPSTDTRNAPLVVSALPPLLRRDIDNQHSTAPSSVSFGINIPLTVCLCHCNHTHQLAPPAVLQSACCTRCC
jgi:hypothetical protein